MIGPHDPTTTRPGAPVPGFNKGDMNATRLGPGRRYSGPGRRSAKARTRPIGPAFWREVGPAPAATTDPMLRPPRLTRAQRRRLARAKATR